MIIPSQALIISIKRIINEGVSTNPDECKDVV